jgi:hypothetical protein
LQGAQRSKRSADSAIARSTTFESIENDMPGFSAQARLCEDGRLKLIGGFMRARLAKVTNEPAAGPNQVELRRMIEEAAYYRAEKRGFAPGLETEDWCEAEAEVMAHVRALQGKI